MAAGGVALLALAAAPPAVDLGIRHGLASWGSQAVGAPVRIASARWSPLAGRLELEGIEIANPPGFPDEPALAIGRLSLTWSSLLTPAVQVESVLAEDAHLRYSRSGDRSNLDALEAHLVTALREGWSERPRIVIGSLLARRWQATAAAPVVGQVTVPLADIEYVGIGEAEGGLPPPALAETLFDLLEPDLAKALAHTDYRKASKGAARAVGRGAKKALGKVKGLWK